MNDVENIPNKALLSEEYHKNRTGYEEALAKLSARFPDCCSEEDFTRQLKAVSKILNRFCEEKLSC